MTLTEFRALAERATPGRWHVSPDDATEVRTDNHPTCPMVAETYNADDAAWIAAASPTAVIALIERLERAEAAIYEAKLNAGAVLRWQTDAGTGCRAILRVLGGLADPMPVIMATNDQDADFVGPVEDNALPPRPFRPVVVPAAPAGKGEG